MRRVPGCELGRPTRETLAAGFGFTPPRAFVGLVQTIWDVAEERRLDPYDVFEQILTRPAGIVGRHPDLTPAELFVFADTGSDGEHYGYVVHAPELPGEDQLVGSFEPGPGDGVLYVGRSTAEAVENAVAYWHAERPASEEALEVLARLHLRLDTSRADRVHGIRDGDWVRLVPEVPVGWRYVATSDGIGVLAPEAAFGPFELPPWDAPFDAWMAAARRATEPAARLVVLKEAYSWQGLGEGYHELRDELRATYLALGRPEHAAMVGAG